MHSRSKPPPISVKAPQGDEKADEVGDGTGSAQFSDHPKDKTEGKNPKSEKMLEATKMVRLLDHPGDEKAAPEHGEHGDGTGSAQFSDLKDKTELKNPKSKKQLVSKMQKKVSKEKAKHTLNFRHESHRSCKHFVTRGPLDVIMGVVLLVNAFVVIAEQQTIGDRIASTFQLHPHDVPTETLYGLHHREPFFVFDIIFLAIYVAEQALRISVLRRSWLFDEHEEDAIEWGNLFDMAIVLFGLVDFAISVQVHDAARRSSSMLTRLLRTCRVVKTMRLLRVMKLFKQLRSLVETWYASLSALFWSMILLTICQMIAALVLCETSVPVLLDPDSPHKASDKQWLFDHYGTFMNASYTFEITFSGGWPALVRPLLEDFGFSFAFPCMLYVVLVVFAALRLISALFVRSTLQLLSNDTGAAVLERFEQSAELERKLVALFHEADEEGDQSLTLEELRHLLSFPEIVHYFSILEVDVHDAEMLFHVLDDGDGVLTVKEFCDGIPRIRGVAKSLDIVCLQREAREMRLEFQNVLQQLDAGPIRRIQPMENMSDKLFEEEDKPECTRI